MWFITMKELKAKRNSGSLMYFNRLQWSSITQNETNQPLKQYYLIINYCLLSF